MAPAVAPIPTALPTVRRGNISDANVNRFADHPWCAEVAKLISATTSQRLVENGAYKTGSMHNAQISMVIFLAKLMLDPRLISPEDSQPPPMLPKLAAL